MGDALAKALGLGHLGGQLALELGDTLAKADHFTAFRGQFRGGRCGVALLLGETFLGLADLALKFRNLGFEVLHLGPERKDLNLLVAAEHAAPTDVRGEFGEMGLFVGKRSFGLVQGVALGGQFVLGGV